MKKILTVFTFSIMDDMLTKGNVWYVRNYEEYFDKVYIVYLSGQNNKIVSQGHTTLVSLGSSKKALPNLLQAPCRFYWFCRKIKPTAYLTADLIFSWWTAIIVKLWLRAKIVLMPVCMPDNLYRISGRTVTGLSRNLEKIMTNLCFLTADRVLTSSSFGNFVNWLSADRRTTGKVKVVPSTVEALPSPEFFIELAKQKVDSNHRYNSQRIQLLYVGRLSAEKMVEDLIKIMKILASKQPSGRFLLKLIGDGPQKESLVALTRELGVEQAVQFAGSVRNEELVRCYLSADIFVSPLTGSSLREAALCGLPIVAYDTDWISGFLKHREEALLVPPREVEKMAEEIITLADDLQLRNHLINVSAKLAEELWTRKGLKQSLAQSFDGL
jgi:glycosyltransferase involved in cell wall biosynthesis